MARNQTLALVHKCSSPSSTIQNQPYVLSMEWLSAYGNDGDRPKSLLNVLISGVGWSSNKHQEEDVYDEQSSEYEGCFCSVTFLTWLQQFCGVIFSPMFEDECAFPISCSTQSQRHIYSNFLVSSQPTCSSQQDPDCVSCYYAMISG